MPVETIKRKMKDIKYMLNAIKQEGIMNSIHNSNGTQLYNHILNNNGNISLALNLLDIKNLYKNEIILKMIIPPT